MSNDKYGKEALSKLGAFSQTISMIGGVFPSNLEIPVMCLHPENPAEVIKGALRKGYEFVFISELYDAIQGKGRLPVKPALLTYDDGRKELYTVCHPVIVAYGVKTNVFITSEFLYQRPVDGTLEIFAPGMTWDNAREMNSSGLYEWQNHTKNHKGLPSQTSEERLADLEECNQAIMNELGVARPMAIAYPNGAYNPATMKDLAQIGITMGFAYQHSYQSRTQKFSTGTVNMYSVNRSTVPNATVSAWLDDVGTSNIYEWTNDCDGQRNEKNKLGYWKTPSGFSFDGYGENLRIDSRTISAEQTLETSDFYRVNVNDRIYAHFYSQSEVQTAGSAKIRIAQYGKDKELIGYIDVVTLTATQKLTFFEDTFAINDACKYVKVQMYCDAAYDGLLHMRNGVFSVVNYL